MHHAPQTGPLGPQPIPRRELSAHNQLHAPTKLPREDRFARLIGPAAWRTLPSRVQHRFSKDLSDGQCAVYTGAVVETKLNTVGWLLARLTTVIGSPLPRDDGATGPAVVLVTQNPKTKAQNWIRTYSRPNGAMHTIASEKRFSGPTGLEEYVGAGIGMTLAVKPIAGGLEFTSERYFFDLAGMRLLLPKVLAPGVMTITHRDQGDGHFAFDLTLHHQIFGRLLTQRAVFRDNA